MNREELEKLFDEKLNKVLIKIRNHDVARYDINKDIKNFLFYTVIKEVLESVMYNKGTLNLFKGTVTKDGYLGIECYHDNIKQKAEELYGINL